MVEGIWDSDLEWVLGVGKSMSAIMDVKKFWGAGAFCEASLGKVLGWCGSLKWESKKRVILEGGAVKRMGLRE